MYAWYEKRKKPVCTLINFPYIDPWETIPAPVLYL